MAIKFIRVLHLTVIAILIGGMVPFQNLEGAIPIGTLFFTGCLVLHNIINRISLEKNNHIFK